ncbi:hypothetical protein GCM10010512_41880 [Streptomyces thermoviolaceus subsp. thermoviolaceus]|nr:hypothetical protein GCM10010499_17180 [Streptomyces thermoviolaceus subsp. apingens]GHB06060.1 hypothetical protein GCM10010512_41880 [Streptomyces thermoviolaceus subsp. thermoviolaceus]
MTHSVQRRDSMTANQARGTAWETVAVEGRTTSEARAGSGGIVRKVQASDAVAACDRQIGEHPHRAADAVPCREVVR